MATHLKKAEIYIEFDNNSKCKCNIAVEDDDLTCIYTDNDGIKGYNFKPGEMEELMSVFYALFKSLKIIKDEKIYDDLGVTGFSGKNIKKEMKRYACMPLKKNIREGHFDWKLVNCPDCGQECWESSVLRNLYKDILPITPVCTECALKKTT